MNTIKLINAPLGEGSTRKVYIHPKDCNKCIKIEKKKVAMWKRKRANKNEYKKLSKLSNLNSYTKNFGFVDTNLGKGLVFELIKNSDKTISLTLKNFVKKYSISDDLIYKLNELKKNLLKDQLLIDDLNLQNILVQTDTSKIEKLIVCDGITKKTIIDVRKFMYTKFLKKMFIERKFRKLGRKLKKN
jgi:hypothetical protein